MKSVSIAMTDKEVELVDLLISDGFAGSRAGLVRQAMMEYAYNRGYIIRRTKYANE